MAILKVLGKYPRDIVKLKILSRAAVMLVGRFLRWSSRIPVGPGDLSLKVFSADLSSFVVKGGKSSISLLRFALGWGLMSRSIV